ncbi:hypothetical protein KUW15_03910 [Qipengyuania aquimaris]|uniref:hypothetical protein n=1 Tax=Qipengyuania aquimaris TaxID=255984 RepID=UPI001C976414|nr:hypothetical protein [Qipengyuania aquimaris]MBY6127855.1 hypothetical protein [Qipengyuania aquimaris]
MSISPAQLTRMVGDGVFPAPLDLSPGVRGGGKGYLMVEVVQWIKLRIRQREETLLEREAKGYDVYRHDQSEAPTLPSTMELVKLLASLEDDIAKLEVKPADAA